jgi:hypothetical protein
MAQARKATLYIEVEHQGVMRPVRFEKVVPTGVTVCEHIVWAVGVAVLPDEAATKCIRLAFDQAPQSRIFGILHSPANVEAEDSVGRHCPSSNTTMVTYARL